MEKRTVFITGVCVGYVVCWSKPVVREIKRRVKEDLRDRSRDVSTGKTPIKITVDTKDAAVFLMDSIKVRIETFGFATRADLRELCGFTYPVPGMDLGWDNPLDIWAYPGDDGYEGKWIVEFPKPKSKENVT